MWWLARILADVMTTPLLRTVLDVVERAQRTNMHRKALEAELRQAIAAQLTHLAETELKARRDVLRAEIAGESALQRLWRPVVALTAFFSYWYVIVAVPHLVAWGVMAPPRFGEKGLDNLFWLAAISVGGYIGARTAEKLARLRRPAP